MGILTTNKPVTFILTRDREKLKPFYRDVLGLTQLYEDPFGTTFALGDGATMRLTTIADHTPGMHTVLGWQVADIKATIKALKEKGVAPVIYPGFGQDDLGIWHAPDGKAKVAWFLDPEGNNLSITSS
ncbi:MAG TPA: VOC family protein [Micropepsaceae bacterium]|nr:VOC family protein [Micropepsaceae bacterium]